MSQIVGNRYSNTRVALERKINELKVRLQVSEKNKALFEEYSKRNKTLKGSQELMDNLVAIAQPMLSDTQRYIAEKRENSMQNINNALRLAGEVIPDSTEGIRFVQNGDEAWLSTPDGLEVDDVEGGGFRQISSTFIRSVLLESINDTLNTMFLDEIFSRVSVANSVVLSLYLNVMCQDMQVISIEQKPEIYANIDCRMFQFSKSGDYSSITMKDVKREVEK